MDIKTRGKGKNKMNILFEGEDLAIPNLLKWELNRDDKVEMTGFQRGHPVLEDPLLIIKSKQILPSTALKRAVDRILKQTRVFKSKT